MRTKNPALIRSQERRDRELKKINTILILPIEKKSQSTEIDQTEANWGRKKRNTIYRKTRREEEKRRQKQARKENNTERN
jgi:hypothetical protein